MITQQLYNRSEQNRTGTGTGQGLGENSIINIDLIGLKGCKFTSTKKEKKREEKKNVKILSTKKNGKNEFRSFDSEKEYRTKK